MRNYNNRSRNNGSRNNNTNNNRKNNNNNNNHSKSFNPTRSLFDSNSPVGKTRGTAAQIVEKYTTLGNEFRVSGDVIRAEEYFQTAEHYARLIIQYNIDNPAPEREAKQPQKLAYDKKDSETANRNDTSENEATTSENKYESVSEKKNVESSAKDNDEVTDSPKLKKPRAKKPTGNNANEADTSEKKPKKVSPKSKIAETTE